MAFLGKRIDIKPGSPAIGFNVAAQAPKTVLGSMKVQVTQSGNDHMAAVIHHLDILIVCRQFSVYPGRNSIFTHNICIVMADKTLFFLRIHNCALQGKYEVFHHQALPSFLFLLSQK